MRQKGVSPRVSDCDKDQVNVTAEVLFNSLSFSDFPFLKRGLVLMPTWSECLQGARRPATGQDPLLES